MESVARVPAGERLYVFGDLHGRSDLFLRLEREIARDSAENPPAEITVIGLGDVIDRGPDSRGIIAKLSAGFADARTVCLRGNHEQMMLDFLDDPTVWGPDWVVNGALETLLSYGVEERAHPQAATPDDFRALRDRFAAALPADHLAAVRSWPLSYTVGGYFFSHAGARPGVALDRQDPRDLIWFRNGGKDDDPPYEKVVVHGHTPLPEPFLGRHRINLDTGAWYSGRLTCLVLEGAGRRLLAV